MRVVFLFVIFAWGGLALWGIAPLLGMVYAVVVGGILLACGIAAVTEKLSAPTLPE
jgi:hypothetical protein